MFERPGRRGKLRGAARLVAVGRPTAATVIPSEVTALLEDLEAWGASPQVIAANRAALMPKVETEDFRVFPENVTAVRCFQAMATQWKMLSVNTMDRAEIRQVGLDYGVLESTARLAGLSMSPDDFDRVRVMEAEALTAWAEARA